MRAPGAALLHPFTLTALVVLVVNDHVLKRVCPSVLTGKLSDFAGVLLLPVFLHAVVEVTAARWRRPLRARASRRALGACLVIAALAFALPELWLPAELLFRYGLALAQWPVRAVTALLTAGELPPLVPVRATADVTDLLALPMVLAAWRVARPPDDQGATPRKVAMTAATPRVGSACVQV